jgi:hypothetical protein
MDTTEKFDIADLMFGNPPVTAFEVEGLYVLATENANLREMLRDVLSLAGTVSLFMDLRTRQQYTELRKKLDEL